MGSSRNSDTLACTHRCPCILTTVRIVCCLRRMDMRTSGGRSRVSWFPSIDGWFVEFTFLFALYFLAPDSGPWTCLYVSFCPLSFLSGFISFDLGPISPTSLFALTTHSVNAVSPLTCAHTLLTTPVSVFLPSRALNCFTHLSSTVPPHRPVLLLYHHRRLFSVSHQCYPPNIRVIVSLLLGLPR